MLPQLICHLQRKHFKAYWADHSFLSLFDIEQLLSICGQYEGITQLTPTFLYTGEELCEFLTVPTIIMWKPFALEGFIEKKVNESNDLPKKLYRTRLAITKLNLDIWVEKCMAKSTALKWTD